VVACVALPCVPSLPSLLPLSWPEPLTPSLPLAPVLVRLRLDHRSVDRLAARIDSMLMLSFPLPLSLSVWALFHFSISLALRKHSVDDQRTVFFLHFFFFPSLSDPISSFLMFLPFSHLPILSCLALLFHSFLDLFTRIYPSSLIEYAPVLNQGF